MTRRELDIGHQRLIVLERDKAQLQQQVATLQSHQQRLDERLNAFMAAQTRLRQDLPSSGHVEHHSIARQYQVLIEQSLHPLARATEDLCWPAPPHFPPVPWHIGQLSGALFHDRPHAGAVEAALGLEGTAPPRVHELIHRTLSEAQSLWQRAGQAGLAYQWDFGLLPGSSLDPARQTAWPSCDPGLPAQFVVAPAYLVEGTVYCHQRVGTGLSLPE
ncbi:hypothetical protein [Streptomyces jumonjinensis]|uniref:hypothetical protein n=1 Tax=Streptomyces jumonjinensis TaxID=1945 RepID=UPI0037888EBE